MVYCVAPGPKVGEYLVVSGGQVFGTFDVKKDAEELSAYLNGGDIVPSYMTEKKEVV